MPPPETFDQEIFADLPGKKRQGKCKRGENEEEKKENCKREGGKLKKEGKSCKMSRGPFFFFFFFFFLLFTFQNDKNLFWVYQNGNFLSGKSISCREKIKKNDFAPSGKFSCYAPEFTASKQVKYLLSVNNTIL